MVKTVLSVMVFGAIVLSGCSQKEAEVKAPVAAKKAVEKVKKAVVPAPVVEKAVVPAVPATPSVRGGAAHIPFSEMAQ